MDVFGLNHLLALAPSPQPGQKSPPAWTNLVFLGVMGLMFYIALIRPQQKRNKDHAALLKTVRSGDRIVTNSGIVGTVVSVKDKTISIRSADSKFEITKAAVAEITERSGEAAETKSAT